MPSYPMVCRPTTDRCCSTVCNVATQASTGASGMHAHASNLSITTPQRFGVHRCGIAACMYGRCMHVWSLHALKLHHTHGHNQGSVTEICE